MKNAKINMTYYFTDDEVKRTTTITLKENIDEKKQIEEFINGYRNSFKYLNSDFINLIVHSVVIEYVKKEILDVEKLDI